MRKNSPEGKPLMDGLGEQKNVKDPSSMFSDDTNSDEISVLGAFDSNTLVSLESVGAIPTNVTGLNDHWH